MDTQTSKSPHPLMWAAAIALIVFCGAGVAAVMGWIPTSLGKPDEPALVVQDKAKPAAPKAATVKSVPAAAVAAKCLDCGVVQSVREIEAKGTGSGIGAVAGGVAGAVVGHEVMDGKNQGLATIAGGVAGAIAGNEIEKYTKTGKTYEITVRFDDGSSRVITEATAPAWRSGDKVRVVNGVIQSNA